MHTPRLFIHGHGVTPIQLAGDARPRTVRCLPHLELIGFGVCDTLDTA